MTVVAYRDGIMASDSCWSDNGLITTLNDKIVRLKTGALLGEAGDADSREMRELLTEATEYSTMPSRKALLETGLDYHAILVLPDGSIWDISCDPKTTDAGIYRVNRKLYAVGCAKMLAIGAMMRGATPKEAVEDTCEWHTECRLPVQVVTL